MIRYFQRCYNEDLDFHKHKDPTLWYYEHFTTQRVHVTKTAVLPQGSNYLSARLLTMLVPLRVIDKETTLLIPSAFLLSRFNSSGLKVQEGKRGRGWCHLPGEQAGRASHMTVREHEPPNRSSI